jgi:hypothetical protein
VQNEDFCSYLPCRQDRPSHKLSPETLEEELMATGQLLADVRASSGEASKVQTFK